MIRVDLPPLKFSDLVGWMLLHLEDRVAIENIRSDVHVDDHVRFAVVIHVANAVVQVPGGISPRPNLSLSFFAFSICACPLVFCGGAKMLSDSEGL